MILLGDGLFPSWSNSITNVDAANVAVLPTPEDASHTLPTFGSPKVESPWDAVCGVFALKLWFRYKTESSVL